MGQSMPAWGHWPHLIEPQLSGPLVYLQAPSLRQRGTSPSMAVGNKTFTSCLRVHVCACLCVCFCGGVCMCTRVYLCVYECTFVYVYVRAHTHTPGAQDWSLSKVKALEGFWQEHFAALSWPLKIWLIFWGSQFSFPSGAPEEEPGPDMGHGCLPGSPAGRCGANGRRPTKTNQTSSQGGL